MTGLLKSNMDFYKRVVDNEKLRDKLKVALFDLLYEDFGAIIKKIKTHGWYNMALRIDLITFISWKCLVWLK